MTYAGGEFLTGDEIVVALFEYGAALAEVGTAGSVEIPIRTAAGHSVMATFLVGPASQIVAIDAGTSDDELIDGDVVDVLRRLTRRLRPVASSADEGVPSAEEYD